MNGHQKQKEQSGRMIEEALFALMKEKRYEQITVSELVKKADVSRRTFYRLYKEKDGVLRIFFQKLCREYCETSPALQSYDIAQIARSFFSFWYHYRELLLLLSKSKTDELLYAEIGRACTDVVRSRISKQQLQDMDGIMYFADYSAGGFMQLLRRWIVTGMKEDPKQYAEKVSRALLKFMEL